MKLQNLSVIFIIIVLPIILVLAYYMSLQADTLNLQAAYNTKLLDSTKEAIDAFEINTVEWNANYSETADSKRRDVMASINTFTNSFANNLGVSGTSKEYILANVPAIAFTLYDGYYIYSPADTKVTIKDENGLTIFYKEKLLSDGKITGCTYDEKNEDKILYKPKNSSSINGYYNGEAFTLNINDAEIEYKHILKPFTSYSENVETEKGDKVVINYTLDNYITLYGKMKDTDGQTKYVSRSGYLTDLSKIEGVAGYKGAGNVTFDGKRIEPEILSEVITYKEEQDGIVRGIKAETPYVYEAEGNTKVYIDDSEDKPKFFILNKDLERVYVEKLSDSKPLYKKYTYPKTYSSGITTYIEIYQKLSPEDTNWYKRNEKGEYVQISASDYGVEGVDVKYDFSAINYCVESYVFTKWINSLGLKLEDGTILKVDSTNDPENEYSAFTNHKKEIIKEVVTSNLNQAITSYSRNSNNGDYYLPELTQTDWDQILTNVSVITFVQNIPIGLKYYNNYAIATSTVNKEYVNPNEIYLYDENNNKFDDTTGSYIENTEGYYHTPYCDQLEDNKLIGYRSIDFIKKTTTFGKDELGQEVTEHYYKHEPYVTQICYNCLVQRSEYQEDKTDLKQKAYYTALARERYIARMSKLPSEVEPSYSFYVMPIDENNPTDESGKYKVLSGAKYTIKDSGNVFEEETYIGDTSYEIKKSDVNNEFTITAEIEGHEIKSEDEGGKLLPKGDYGDLDNPKNTIVQQGDYSVYESNAETKINIMQYDTEYLRFNINAKNTIYKIEQTGRISAEVEANNEGVSSPYQFSLDDDGNIFIYLKYRKNYESSATASLKAYANINNYGNLTIATQIKEITGKVVLKFYNEKTGKAYWSENAFEVEDGSIVYCRIGGDGSSAETSWYQEDWKVYVYAVDYHTQLAEGNVEYYTVRDEKGLKGFADAVNSRAKTKDRKFYLVNNITMSTTMNPIAQGINGAYNLYFNGLFSGGKYVEGVTLIDAGTNHSITNLRINVDNEKGNYYAFGLFGWVGKDGGTIEKIAINNINVKYEGTNNDIKVGGLIGYCDTGASISGITITGGTIEGGTYTGGIVGKSDREINNCTLNSINSIKGTGKLGGIVGQTSTLISDCTANITTICNSNFSGNGLYELIIGGIVGYTTGTIQNSSITATNIGNGNVTMKTKSSNEVKVLNITIGGINKYCVGGIVGQLGTDASIIGNTVNVSNIKGGKVSVGSSTDNKAFNCIGGIVGYKQSSQETNSSWSINCNVSGYDNVGGIVGYNASGNITGITRTGNVYGSGENVGGIVGINLGGTISNCINQATITGVSGNLAENVGGIVGYNYCKNLTNCYNESTVTGDKNVGGIVGIIYNSTIKSCSNKAKIEGNANSNILDTPVGLEWLWTGNQSCTGTGGIAGKIYGATVTCSYNEGNVVCNYNGGGISGINYSGKVEYSFNSGNVESTDESRIGGISGACNGVTINSCYNKGEIKGNVSGNILANGIGGILGFVVDNSYYVGTDQAITKYLEIEYTVLSIKSTANKISYCYNVGNLTGGNLYMNGIVGGIEVGTNTDRILIEKCYYLNSVENANRYLVLTIPWGPDNGGTQGLSSENIKKPLYKWASKPSGEGGTFYEGSKHTYCTTAPLETELGHQGYGILWWQIEDYVRLETYICSGYSLKGQNYYTEIEKFCNTKFEIKKNDNLASVILDDEENRKNYNVHGTNVNCHSWTMMIKRDNANPYYLQGSADEYPASGFIERYAQNNLEVLIILGATVDEIELYPNGTATMNWSSFTTTVKRDTIFKYNHGKDYIVLRQGESQIPAIYSGKIKDSSIKKDFTKSNLQQEDNNYGYVYLDGAGLGFNLGSLAILTNATATLQDYTIEKYYKTKSDVNVFNWDYTFWENETVSGDTEKIVGKAGTTIQIPIEDIEVKTKNEAGQLPFVNGESKVLSATAYIKCYAFLEGNTVEKILDFIDLFDLDILKDELKVWVEIGGKTVNTEPINVNYGWHNNESNKITVDIPAEINILDINTGEIPKTVSIKLEWGAKLVGMNFAIDRVMFKVRYTSPSATE